MHLLHLRNNSSLVTSHKYEACFLFAGTEAAKLILVISRRLNEISVRPLEDDECNSNVVSQVPVVQNKHCF